MVVQVGLDLVAVKAVEDALKASHGQQYLERVYTPIEIQECTTRHGLDVRRLAECFAAKEAAIKILQTDEGLSMRTIEVRREAFGKVRLVLSGRAEELAIEAGVASLALSVAHDAAFATAFLVAEILPATASIT
jgi:holo-[acyl-carrier protein] synthase